MQFFPVAQDLMQTAAEAAGSAINKLTDAASGGGFSNVLSSFIEEGRTDYSGRPAGFSSFGVDAGTLGETEGNLLKNALRKRNVSELSIEALEQLMNSGSPVTIGSIFNTLSGNSRLSGALEGDELDSFKMLLGKLGFSKDDMEAMIGLSDEGDTKGMWRMLSGKLDAMDGDVDVTRKEFAALLTGLDASAKTKKALLSAFQENESYQLNKEQLEGMLAKVNAEAAQREQAAAKTRLHMRSAVEEALENTKRQEQMASVDDMRGNRRSEQKEEFMRDSVLKRTGAVDALQDEGDSAEQAAQQDLMNGKDDPRNRAERILATLSGKEGTEQAKPSAKPAQTEAAHMLHRIDAAVTSIQPNTVQGAGQNLESVARNFRQEIFSQVENGILQNMQSGTQRLTLQLNPAELGQVTLVVSMQQGELKATIRAEQPESATVLREHMAELKTALEAEGIKVKDLDVQTGLRDADLGKDFTDPGEHNFMHDTQERDRMMRLARIRRDTANALDTAGDSPTRPVQLEDSGLHIVA